MELASEFGMNRITIFFFFVASLVSCVGSEPIPTVESANGEIGICCPFDENGREGCNLSDFSYGGWAKSLAQCEFVEGTRWDGLPLVRGVDEFGCPAMVVPNNQVRRCGSAPPQCCPIADLADGCYRYSEGIKTGGVGSASAGCIANGVVLGEGDESDRICLVGRQDEFGCAVFDIEPERP